MHSLLLCLNFIIISDKQISYIILKKNYLHQYKIQYKKMGVSVLTEKKIHNVNKNCNFLKKNNKLILIDLYFHNVKRS